ncbi:MAG: class I SAM-dependent methyltransferase [Anaerolineaceae bacterium]|nr:MAG: class I SAM-dependent methyltransferase [Anaerolineaceae bacterium]
MRVARLSMSNKDYFWLNLRDLPYFRAMLRAVEAQFYADYELPAPMLDVGCGDGHFASIAFDKSLDVGVDPWSSPIRRATTLGGHRFLVQSDGGRLPFPDEYYGSAISNSALEHIVHVEEVLRETARVLKPGAPFLFTVPNPAYFSELAVAGGLQRLGLGALSRAYTEWFRRVSRVFHAEPRQVWRAWLDKAGFSLEESWHYFPPEAMHVLEWGHYLGAPTLLPHVLVGRWIISPTRWNLALTDRLVRPYVRAEPHPQGTFTFYVAKRK